MIDPAPYDYDTETFDKEAALRHVLSYPSFENALSNHKEQLHEYLSLSGIIADGMEQSYKVLTRPGSMALPPGLKSRPMRVTIPDAVCFGGRGHEHSFGL